MRRLRLIERIAVSGLRWAKELADHVLLLLGVLLLAAGIAVGGVLLHRPAWFLGVAGGVLVLLILGEGAYRTWDEADRRAEAVRVELAGDHRTDAMAVWLSEQLSAGNKLLARWHAGKPSYNARDEIQGAADWEHKTQDGLAATLPTYSGLFGLDVGLGQEFIFSPIEVVERTRLRRRLHRLGEIADRYSREQSK